MSTRSGRIRTGIVEASPPRTRPARSPGRPRKTSPLQKSPSARQSARKSPARRSPSRKTVSPTRKTSPSRQPLSKFPARKSPARTTKEVPAAIVPAHPKSPIKRPALKSDVSVKLENLSASVLLTANTRSRRTIYSVEDVSSTKSEYALDRLNGIEPLSDNYGLRNRRSVEEVPPRRSSRLRDFIDVIPEADIRRSLSKSQSQSKSISSSVSKSIDAYSDEEHSGDEQVREKSKTVIRKLSTPLRNSISAIHQIASRYEFGGRVGTAALIFLIPLTVVSILTSCMKSCSINTLINFSPFKSLSLWFSIPSAVIVIIQIFLQGTLTIIPIFGRWADRMDNTERKQYFNGLFAAIFTVIILYSSDHFKIINKNALLGDYLKLATGSYIFAVLLSIVLYLKSRKSSKNDLNPYGSTGYLLYDFFVGSEVHPQIKKLDVKIWISRICNINTLVLSSLIFVQGIKLQLKKDEKIDITNIEDLHSQLTLSTILVFSIMQMTYILSYISKEYKMTSTFYWKYEGVGYMQTVSSALYPYFFTTISKYISDTNLKLSTNILILALGLYTLGFIIMLASNSIKHEFRRDPIQPSFSNVESMPTFHGNKLLTCGLWGTLRHPNYAGDIIIHIALSLPGIMTGEVIVASPALITILVLLHRSWRDHARCNRRYGAAWQRYCKKVPSVILPKIL